MQIGIVIPCRNDQQYLKECLESVVNQTVKPASVVVVDDCSLVPISRDDFPVNWDGFPVWLIRNGEKLGLAASRNIGVTLVGTPWYIPLDADNLLVPTALETLTAIVTRFEDVDVVQGGVTYFGDVEAPHQDLSFPLPMKNNVLMARNVADATALIKVSVWEALGGYNEIGRACHRGYEDWDFWIRVHWNPTKFKVYQTSEALLAYRVRGGSKLSTQEYDASRAEMMVRFRHLWNLPKLAGTALKDLRGYWEVKKVKP